MKSVKADSMPPRQLMEKIMDKTAKIYCFLWEKKNEQGKLFLSWEELVNFYHKNSFRTAIRNLLRQELLKSYKESDKGVKIELEILTGDD